VNYQRRPSSKATGSGGGHAVPVMLVHTSFQAPSDGQPPAYRMTIDIVENATHAPSLSFENRVRAGVADTVLETVMLGASDSFGNASALLAAEPDGWTVLSAADEGAIAALAVTDDVKARIMADQSSGYVVVVPSTPTGGANTQSFAYWRVDPTSGATLGMGSGGHGANMVEYSREVIRAVKAVWAFHPWILCAVLSHNGYLESKLETNVCFIGAGFYFVGMATKAAIASAAAEGATTLSWELVRLAATGIGSAVWASVHVREDFQQLIKDKVQEWVWG